MTTSPDDYSEEFKRQVVAEALTSARGFPAVAEQHGLAPGLVFEWVDRYGPPRPPAPFSALHVWVGQTPADRDAFLSYFAHADDYWEVWEDTEDDDGDVTGCAFCVDLGEKHLYDEDLLLAFHSPSPIALEQLMDELAFNTAAAEDAVIQACQRRGIDKANAAFTYADPTQVVSDSDKTYNGLIYLGLFQDKAP